MNGTIFRTITMPPDNLQGKDLCLVYPEPLNIEFKDNGYFGCSDSNVFTPPLLVQQVAKGQTIGAFTPQANNTKVGLAFLDSDKNRSYAVNLLIQSKCP